MRHLVLLVLVSMLFLSFFSIPIEDSVAQANTIQPNKYKLVTSHCWEDFSWYSIGKDYSYKEAVSLGITINKESPGWYEYLPSCPLREPTGNENWELDTHRDIVGCLHPSATSCYRSSESYDSASARDHGQQCCYNSKGWLIRSGPGAGTPDFKAASAFNTVTMRHLDTDVMPFIGMVKELGFNRGVAENAKYWPPNQGELYMWKGQVTDTDLDVRNGDLIKIDAKGQVQWGAFGSSCDADGSPNKGELIYLPPPLPTAKTGSLLGYIVADSGNVSGPFLVGKSNLVRMPASGRLYLGINDAIIENNSGYFLVSIRRVRPPYVSPFYDK